MTSIPAKPFDPVGLEEWSKRSEGWQLIARQAAIAEAGGTPELLVTLFERPLGSGLAA